MMRRGRLGCSSPDERFAGAVAADLGDEQFDPAYFIDGLGIVSRHPVQQINVIAQGVDHIVQVGNRHEGHGALEGRDLRGVALAGDGS